MPIVVAIALAGVVLGWSPPSPPATGHGRSPRVEWRESVAAGAPEAGRLQHGVRLPAQGHSYFTWDPILRRQPDRDWRRWGTDDLVRTALRVLREFRRRHPQAPRIGVGDLSLRHGGYFGAEVGGGIGHATHQNGLDVDVYYPRLDRRERAPTTVDQVDVALSQDLLDLFVAAGAVTIYVGPNLPLTGRPRSSPRSSTTTTTCTSGSRPERRPGRCRYLPLRSVFAPTRASGPSPSRRPLTRVAPRP